ncbi:MAG: type IV toxin-antitoxin system AbiEi family antitoxin domain-containing protein [Gemmatimonadales bacterium]
MPHELASLGPGPFTVAEAELAGVREPALRHGLKTGRLRRVVRGVYASGAPPDTLEVRAAAVALVAPAGSVVCGRTAAWLYGVDALAMGAHRVLPDVDIMVAAGRSASRRVGVFGSSGPLRNSDVVIVGTVPVTAPARTTADLARLLRRPDALAAVDAMLRLRVTTVNDVRHELGLFAGHRGVAQARGLLALASPLAESPQESRVRLRCVDAGFPSPEPQIVLRLLGGRFVARLDMGWRLLMRAVEFDGAEDHSTPEDLRHDRHRREAVEALGWGIAVVTSREVLSRTLEFERIVSELLAMPYQLSPQHPARGGWEGTACGRKRSA